MVQDLHIDKAILNAHLLEGAAQGQELTIHIHNGLVICHSPWDVALKDTVSLRSCWEVCASLVMSCLERSCNALLLKVTEAEGKEWHSLQLQSFRPLIADPNLVVLCDHDCWTLSSFARTCGKPQK